MKKKYRIVASLGAVLFPSAVVSTVVISSLKNLENNSSDSLYKKIVQKNTLNYGESISDSNENYEFWILDKILQKEERSDLQKNLFGLDEKLEIPGKPSFSVKKDSKNYNPEILYEDIIELNLVNTKEKFDSIINEIYNQIYEKIRDSDKTFGLNAKKINPQKIIITAYEMQDKTSLTDFSRDFLEYVKSNKDKISKQFKYIGLENKHDLFDNESESIKKLFENEIELFSNEKILNPFDFFEALDSKKHFENSKKISFDEEKLIYNEKIVITYSKDFNPFSNSLEFNFNFYEISSKTVFEDNINKDFFIYKPKDALTVNNKIKLQQDKFLYYDNPSNLNESISLDEKSKIVKALVNLQKRFKELISGKEAFKNKLDILNLKYKNPKIANLIIEGIEKIISIDFSNIPELRKIVSNLNQGNFKKIFKNDELDDTLMSNFIYEISDLSKISCNPPMLKFIFFTHFLTVNKDYEKINFREVKDSISVTNILRYSGINSLPAWYTLKHPAKSLIEIISYKLAKPHFDFDSLFLQSFNKNIFKKILKNDEDYFFNEILYEIFTTFINDFRQFRVFIETVIKENNQIFQRIIKSNNYEMENYDKKASLFFRRIFSDNKYHKISRDEDSVFKILLKGLKIEHDPLLKNFGVIIKTIGNFDFLPKLLKRYLVPNMQNKQWLSNLYQEGKFLHLYEMVVDIKEKGLVDFMVSDQKVNELIELLKSLEVQTLFKNRVDKEVDLSIEGLLGTIKQMIQNPMSQWNQIFDVEDNISQIGYQDPNLAFNKLMKVFLIFEEDIDEKIVKRIVNERESFFELFNLIINFIKLKKTDDLSQKFMSNFKKLLNNELLMNSGVHEKMNNALLNATEIMGEHDPNFLIEFFQKLLFKGFEDADNLYAYFLNFLKIKKSDLENKPLEVKAQEEYYKKLYTHNFVVCFIKLIFEDDKKTESNLEVIIIDGEDKEKYVSNYKNGILSIFNEIHLSDRHRKKINIFKKIFKKGFTSLEKWEINYLIAAFQSAIDIIPEILSNNKFLAKNFIPIFSSMSDAKSAEYASENYFLKGELKKTVQHELEENREIKNFLEYLGNKFLLEILIDILNNGFLNISEESKDCLDKIMNFPNGSFSAILKLINSSFAGITKQEFKKIFLLFLNSIERITKKESESPKWWLSLEKNMTLICDAMYGVDE